MAIIKSGNSTDQLTVDATSKAARVTLYNPDGSLQIPGVKASYLAYSTPFTPGATPQDIFTLTGSATKIVRVLRMFLATLQTNAGVSGWSILKRSTANAGGTSAAVVSIRSDQNDSAATATALQYTANPTAGNLIGKAWSGFINAPKDNTAGIGGNIGVFVDFPDSLGKPITLRSISDVLAWNFEGATLPAGLIVRAGVLWTEE